MKNMEDYDVIFLGYPIWWSDMPMAVYTFLESYDFSGKTIIPFCTHEGSGLSSTDSSIAEICTGADVLDGLEMRGSVAQNSQDEALTAVTDWLDKIEIRRELRRYYHHGKINLNTRMGQGGPEKRQSGSQKSDFP